MYFTYREENQTFQDIGIWSNGGASGGMAKPEQLRAYSLLTGPCRLSARPAVGRWFSQADDTFGSPETVSAKPQSIAPETCLATLPMPRTFYRRAPAFSLTPLFLTSRYSASALGSGGDCGERFFRTHRWTNGRTRGVPSALQISCPLKSRSTISGPEGASC
jgi:hypothetical protein